MARSVSLGIEDGNGRYGTDQNRGSPIHVQTGRGRRSASAPERQGDGALFEYHLIVLDVGLGAHTVESRPDERPLRGDIVQGRLGDPVTSPWSAATVRRPDTASAA